MAIRFYTLLERKILGLTQLRIGPNKTSWNGLLQPILDGLKLFKKFNFKNLKVIKNFFSTTPPFILVVSCSLYTCYPYKIWLNKSLTIFWILFFIGLIRFFILILRWRSSNNLRLIGGLRRICQIISLEINLVFLIGVYFIIFSKANLVSSLDSVRFFIILKILFFIIFIIEVQRSPFDLSERERETVRGFNVEYSGLLFTFIFLSEYLNILFFSGLLRNLIMPTTTLLIWIIFITLRLFCRTCFPRIRYDCLIELNWIKICPLIISRGCVILVLKFL